jgi:hypothetical protein
MWALIFAALFAMPLHVVNADTEANVLQAYITEQTLTVFIDAELRSDGLICAVSNQNATITASGSLYDDGAVIKTTILLDVSTSMPSAVRGSITAMLKTLVERKSANEEFRLIVFGNELVTLQDFTADRFDLAMAIEKIVFDHTQSRIYEAIFDTIPRISQSNGKPTFYRTIVITDGVDNAATGITREELFLKFQGERYPVDVVAVSINATTEDRELAAITRMSGGRYFMLNQNTDSVALAGVLSVGDYFYFEAIVPSKLLNGTTRQVDIGDGVHSISVDVRHPVWSAPIEATPVPPETEGEVSNIETEPSASPESTSLPLSDETNTSNSIMTMFGDYTLVIFIGSGVALIIIAAVIIAMFVIRGKKKKTTTHHESGVPMGYGSHISSEKTEFVNDTAPADSQYTVKISHTIDTSRTWTLAVTEDLLIGRTEHCQIQLDDKSVSREHCKIAVQGIGLAVAHLSATNKTSLNGSNVANSSPLQSGDIIKIGRESLRIDYIQVLGNQPPKSEPHRNSGARNTESIF